MARRARIRISGLEFDDHPKVPASVRGKVVGWEAFHSSGMKAPLAARRYLQNHTIQHHVATRLIERSRLRAWIGGDLDISVRLWKYRKTVGVIFGLAWVGAVLFQIAVLINKSPMTQDEWFALLGWRAYVFHFLPVILLLFTLPGAGLLMLYARIDQSVVNIHLDKQGVMFGYSGGVTEHVHWADVESFTPVMPGCRLVTRSGKKYTIDKINWWKVAPLINATHGHINTGLSVKQRQEQVVRLLFICGVIGAVVAWAIASAIQRWFPEEVVSGVDNASPLEHALGVAGMFLMFALLIWMCQYPDLIRRLRKRWRRARK